MSTATDKHFLTTGIIDFYIPTADNETVRFLHDLVKSVIEAIPKWRAADVEDSSDATGGVGWGRTHDCGGRAYQSSFSTKTALSVVQLYAFGKYVESVIGGIVARLDPTTHKGVRVSGRYAAIVEIAERTI